MRAQSVHLEIEERDGCRLVVRRLRRGVDNQIGAQFFEEGEDTVTVADIESLMAITGNLAAKAFEHPTGVALGAEEDRAMIAIDPENLVSLTREVDRHFGADQSAGSCN